MPKALKKEAAALPQTGKRTRIVDHAAKGKFWKPSYNGEHLIGRLSRITTGGDANRPALRLVTQEGPVAVGINFALVDVDWPKYVGKLLDFTFTGTVGKRNGRTYDVDVIETDDVPF